jgi:hypothetical protein
VISLRLSDPVVMRSMERIGVSSAAVPLKKDFVGNVKRRALNRALSNGDAQFVADLNDAVTRDARQDRPTTAAASSRCRCSPQKRSRQSLLKKRGQ